MLNNRGSLHMLMDKVMRGYVHDLLVSYTFLCQSEQVKGKLLARHEIVYNSYQSSQRHLRPIPRRQRQMQTLLPRAWVSTLKHRECLDQPSSDISCLSECILLSDADSRAAIEWEVFPARSGIFPALRSVLVCVWSVDVFASVH